MSGLEAKLHNLRPGLIVAGLMLIGLIIVDQRVIKHHHCDKEKSLNEVKGEKMEREDEHEEDHSHKKDHVEICRMDEDDHSHSHGHSHDHSHSHGHRELPNNDEEIKGCCTEGLKYKTTIKQALIFIFIFSIHSIFEGFAFTPQQTSSISLFLGLLVHKVLESITVGIALFSSKFKKRATTGLLFVYSMLTPLGMIMAYYISDIFNSWLIKDIFTGIAFGSLSFIVLVEMLPPIVHSLTNPMKVLYLLAGYVVGAIFISMVHSHG
ncbi:solute carrier family 39 (zinc transporter), member 1/2/3 [Nematocida major]|uniref:solute carrier family 39 (zinc transporter), member 1/2/3 n=1 Tax=Nematocida major TaxID=1912982 RepID=UPI002008C530|nr:solute carrier family 39 (zinc transporter), member 1/2/3 [Nematocida major]KAH9385798.1 solute carrier family 39 (zinc transporter), member 1/2/3 [Nematocida major]